MPWPKGAQPVGAGPGEQIQEPKSPPALSASDTARRLFLEPLKGAAKGALSTLSSLAQGASATGTAGGLRRMTPAGQQQDTEAEQYLKNRLAPHGVAQTIGKGLEQTGEFMLPGPAEERLALAAPKAISTAARIAIPAVSSGAVNALQGGDFGTGAAMGASGAALGAGARAAAPRLAESALGIRGPQRAFGKTPGVAALEETKGIRPESILDSGRQRMKDLVKTLEGHVDAASQRPTPPVRGFLMPPRDEIPLHAAPAPRNPRSRPMAFDAEVNPEEPLEPRSGNPHAPISEYPISNPHYLSGSEHPELSGRVTPLQNPEQVTTRMGVLNRRPEMSASIPPAFEANPSASLRGARDVLSSAQGRAAQQEAGTLHGQLGAMQDFLHQGRVSGEPISENITPRRLLDLKRGFSDEHLGWNPDVHDEAVHAGRGAYHQMDTELVRLVPGAHGTSQRISSLIEVLRNADRQSRQAGIGQKLLGRFGAHTGALAGGVGGAYYGGREGGVPGAIAGGTLGLVAPELIASPEGQMGTARLLRTMKTLRPAVGGAAQLTRGNE